ncbi:hypothetical protein [Actinoplanes sp. NPDC051494]|uniref:hypothetical protein n=1 Tax=Actinoplanes sp. NPDC051494 TaxID=3363907 RepID=UPI0037A1FDE7
MLSNDPLERQLRKIGAMSGHPPVKAAVTGAIDQLAGPRRRLLGLLTDAQYTAAVSDEWQIVRLLQGTIDYLGGRIGLPEFMDERPGRYPWFPESPRPRGEVAATPGARGEVAATPGARGDVAAALRTRDDVAAGCRGLR